MNIILSGTNFDLSRGSNSLNSASGKTNLKFSESIDKSLNIILKDNLFFLRMDERQDERYYWRDNMIFPAFINYFRTLNWKANILVFKMEDEQKPRFFSDIDRQDLWNILTWKDKILISGMRRLDVWKLNSNNIFFLKMDNRQNNKRIYFFPVWMANIFEHWTGRTIFRFPAYNDNTRYGT